MDGVDSSCICAENIKCHHSEGQMSHESSLFAVLLIPHLPATLPWNPHTVSLLTFTCYLSVFELNSEASGQRKTVTQNCACKKMNCSQIKEKVTKDRELIRKIQMFCKVFSGVEGIHTSASSEWSCVSTATFWFPPLNLQKKPLS